jgi:hypothetical protein
MESKMGHFLSAPARRLSFFCASVLLVYALIIVESCVTPPIVDLAATDLDVNILVVDPDESPSDNKVLVNIQFFSNGSLVKLANNISVKCNNEALPATDLGYMSRIPIAPANGRYNFQYSRNAVNTNVIVPVQARPVITAPSRGAVIPRSNNLGISYVPGNSVGVHAGASNSSSSTSGDVQDDDGLYEAFNVSSLQAGPGQLGLTRELTFTLPPGDFKSVKVNYSTGSRFNVTWQ